MSDDLVKRLVDWSEHDEGKINDARQEAADRIEALTEQLKTVLDREAATTARYDAKLETLTEQLEAARADAKEAEAYAEELQGDLTELCRQLIAAEDKLAKAVEALDGLLEAITATTQHGDMSLTITGPTANLKWLLETEQEARATLAEIDGEKV